MPIAPEPPDWFGFYAEPAPTLADVLAGPQTPKRRRTRRANVAQIERESGKKVAALKVERDGSRTFVLAEKAAKRAGFEFGGSAPDPVAASDDPYAAAVVKMNARRGAS